MCEYLKADVQSAKTYIRPLESDFSIDSCSPEVIGKNFAMVLLVSV